MEEAKPYLFLKCSIENAPTTMICHQIDCNGKMKSEVSQKLLKKYPSIHDEYFIEHRNFISDVEMLGYRLVTQLIEDYYDPSKPAWCISLMTYIDGEEEKQYMTEELYAERLSVALENVNELIAGNDVAFEWAEDSKYWDTTLSLILKKITYAKQIYFCIKDKE